MSKVRINLTPGYIQVGTQVIPLTSGTVTISDRIDPIPEILSVLPAWWDTTLTVFNKYEDPLTQVVTWHKKVLTKCFWKYVGDKVQINQSVLETNNIICRIPQNIHFLEKYNWVTVPNDEMDAYFTLGRGDIIVKGEVDDVINEYSSGQRSTDLIAKYKELQGCMEIEEVAINVGAGRVIPHYYVKGI